MRRSLRGSCLAALLASLIATSCTTAIDGTPLPADASGIPPAGEPAKAPRPADRDARAVSVALRQLDACKVFDLDAAKAAGNPTATVLPTGPHSCMLAPTPNYTPATHGVEVKVGDGANQLFRDLGAPVTLQGAKAYEYRDYAASKRCELLVPVSFTRAITFEYDTFDDTDTCRVLRPVAEAALGKLQQPDALTVDPARRPGAAWDGCLLLAQVLAEQAPGYTYQPAGLQTRSVAAKPRRSPTNPPHPTPPPGQSWKSPTTRHQARPSRAGRSAARPPRSAPTPAAAR